MMPDYGTGPVSSMLREQAAVGAAVKVSSLDEWTSRGSSVADQMVMTLNELRAQRAALDSCIMAIEKKLMTAVNVPSPAPGRPY